MAHMAIRRDMDMCNGPMLGKMIRFALPIAASGILQQLYNSADMMVVGRFSGKEALAAVGATATLINLIVNLFMGFSIGASVAVARAKGAQEPENVSKAVHTAVAISLMASLAGMIIGIFFSPTILGWMGTPADVLPGATLYMRIYFIGLPFNLVYNFSSAILRAVGDTKRPLYYLSLSGLVNVLLNLLFVIGFHMSVDGVALATILSQALSCSMILRALLHAQDDIRLIPRKIRIHSRVLGEIIRIGLPSGIQSCLLNVANVLIQSAVNSFGSAAIASCTAVNSIQGYLWTILNGFHQANTTFTSQNRGAGKLSRMRRAGLISTSLVFVLSLLIGCLLCLLGPMLLRLYNTDPEVIALGMERMQIIVPFSFLFATYMDLACHLRGMGYSTLPMFASLTGICGFRIVWLNTVFAANPTLPTLYWVFPCSTLFTMLITLSMDLYVSFRIMPRRMAEAAASTPS